jgi:hypothetical protein
MITTNRNRDYHGHTTPDVKKALREEMDKVNVSESRLIHDLMVEGLKRRGYDVSGYEYKVVNKKARRR